MCRNRLWKVACDSSRSDWGFFPRRKHASLSVCGSWRRFWTNSCGAVATGSLLRAVARALWNFVIRIHNQVPVGRAPDLEPRERTGRGPAGDTPSAVESRAVARTGKALFRARDGASQVRAGARDRVEALLIPKENQVLVREDSFGANGELLRRAKLEAANGAGQHGGIRQPQDPGNQFRSPQRTSLTMRDSESCAG